MRRILLCIAVICWAGVSQGQQNLVPNPSFEENTGCPLGAGEIYRAPPWEKVGGTGGINYFHECGAPCCGIPVSDRGGGYARTGQAYVNVNPVYNNHLGLLVDAESNFLGAPLTAPLEAGKRYRAEFHLSLYDSARFAGRNIGVHFSHGKPSSDIGHLLGLVPQVRYDSDAFLADKLRWMPVGGSFVAAGGEDYITIGNFDGYANSQTLDLGEGGVVPSTGYWEVVHYFIDDLSVMEDTAWTGIVEDGHPGFGLWPNPADDAMTVEAEEGKAVGIIDASGREVFQALLHSSKETFSIGHLPAGAYTVAVTMRDGSVARQRLLLH